MADLEPVLNGESGLSVREKLNALIAYYNLNGGGTGSGLPQDILDRLAEVEAALGAVDVDAIVEMLNEAEQAAFAARDARDAAIEYRDQSQVARDAAEVSNVAAALARGEASDFAADSEAAKVAAEAAAAAAALARGEASDFAADSETARAAAEAAQTASQAARDDAQVFAGNADDSAAAAAGSASIASAAEDAASASASAAAASVVAADTARTAAEAARTDAVAARETATDAAATATTQADLAADARLNADSAASAAAGSASIASTKATAAESSATAANTSRVAAQTAAEQAEDNADASAASVLLANSSRDAAAGFAQSASSALTEINARLAEAALIPADMANDGANWTNSRTGSPESVGGLHADVTFDTDTTLGDYARIPATIASDANFVSKGVIPYVANRTYRITVRARADEAVDGRLRFIVVMLDSAYESVANAPSDIDITSADAWQVYSWEWTVPDTAGRAYLRAGVYVRASATPAAVVDVNYIRIDDITNASAAASHSMQAAIYKSDAETAASAAQAAKTAAETARGQAQTFRNEASQAREDAETASAEASSAAGIAVNAKNTAGASASAAAGSASVASTKATDAGTAAAAASTARAAAETARTQAQTFRNDAVAARDEAEGAALLASQVQASMAQLAEGGSGVLSDQFLGTDSGWTVEATAPVWLAQNDRYPIGRTATWNLDANTNAGLKIHSTASQWVGPKNADGYVVEIEFTYSSGTLGGAGMLFRWRNSATANFDVRVSLASMLRSPAATNSPMYAAAVFRKPSNFTGTFARNEVVLWTNNTDSHLTRAAKNIRVNRVFIRPATAEELGGGEVASSMAAYVSSRFDAFLDEDFGALSTRVDTVQASIGTLDASVDTISSALATIDGNMSAMVAFRAKAGSSGALLELVSADSADGGPVSVARIEAQNILFRGTVGMDMLAVGLGRNKLINSNFLDGTESWRWSRTGAAGDQTEVSIRAPGLSNAGLSYPTLRILQAGTSTSGNLQVTNSPVYNTVGDRGPGVPADAGQIVEVSAQLRSYNCNSEILIQWLDSAGDHNGYSSVWAGGPVSAGANNNPESWPRRGGRAPAPANTAFARIVIRKYGTLSGSADSSLYVFHPQLCESHAYATSLAPYAPDGTTVISGNVLKTGIVGAQHIETDSFHAAGFAVFGGDVISANYVSGSSGWRIWQNGNAEFWNMWVRGSLRVGSVSDIWYTTLTGPIAVPSSLTNDQRSLTIGETTADSFIAITCSLELRDTAQDNTTGRNTMQFQWRPKVNGEWEDWVFLEDAETRGPDYRRWSRSYLLPGGYESVQIRARALGRGSVDWAYRNLTIYGRSVQR